MELEKAYLLAVILFVFGIAFSYVNFGGTKGPGNHTEILKELGGESKSGTTEADTENKIDFKINFTEKLANDFIERYKSVAIQEQQAYGIPASITLAQGLLESTAGQSRLAKECRNFFGIKCFSKTCKKGHCKNFTDDTHKDFFRINKTGWASFRQHSELLEKARYKKCHKCENWECWTIELSKAGYATDKDYSKKLQIIINKFKLYEHDEN